MPDPIVRWRNPYFQNVRELIDVLPLNVMPSEEARNMVNENFEGDFFRTAYQLACQLGLYYEKDGVYYPRFAYTPDADDILDYLQNWIETYSVPNPYTRGFNTISPPISVHNSFCQLLFSNKESQNWNEAKLTVFGEAIGNDDILVNTINTYSNVIQIDREDRQNPILCLRPNIRYSDLEIYSDITTTINRNDKAAFFASLDLFDNQFSPDENLALNKIYYGAPGTGKSFIINNLLPDREEFKERVTFHPEYDYTSFVGGYKPVSGDDGIEYKFVPQVFTNIYVKAWNSPHQKFYLVIEEINRGNCAEIFGDIFQILDRNTDYPITPSNELLEHLKSGVLTGIGLRGIKGDKLLLPPNLILWATMNTSDQSLFPMDSAFKRRWDWQYVPICYTENKPNGELNTSYQFIIRVDENITFRWIDFIEKVNTIIKMNPNLGMDKCIGNYFIKPQHNEVELSKFINKAIFYLWNDVFKDEEDTIFIGNMTYEDFFPVFPNGREKLMTILEHLEVGITNSAIEA